MLRVHVHSGAPRLDLGELERLELAQRASGETARGDVVLYELAADQFAQLMPVVEANRAWGIKSVAVTRWWSTILPREAALALSRFDAILTPGAFSREVIQTATSIFRQVPVHRVPLVLDERDEPAQRPQGDAFTFYTIDPNSLDVLRAYLYEFEPEDKTRLVVVHRRDPNEWVAAAQRLLSSVARPAGLFAPAFPVSLEDITRLHQDADCYLTARRDGFDREAVRAAWMQRPVHAPIYGDLRDYLPPKMADIDYQLAPSTIDVRYLWAEPDLHQLSRRMRDTWELFHDDRDYEGFAEIREQLEDRFSAPIVAQELHRVLKEIASC